MNRKLREERTNYGIFTYPVGSVTSTKIKPLSTPK
jgi:hypothetical protein